MTISLTVSNSSASDSESLSVYVIAKEQETEDSESYDCWIPAIGSQGYLVAQDTGTDAEQGAVTTVQLNANTTFWASDDNDMTVTVFGNVFFIANEGANENQGMVTRVDTDIVSGNIKAWDLPDTGVTVQEGDSAGDYFGHCVMLFDLDGDSTNEVGIHAPGAQNIYVYDDTLSTLLHIITEDEDLPLNATSSFVAEDMDSDGFSEIAIVQRYSATDPDLMISLFLSEPYDEYAFITEDRSTSEKKVIILAGTDDLAETIDMGEDASYTVLGANAVFSSAMGDVNGDDIQDLVLISLDECEGYVFYGTELLTAEMTLDDADVIVTGTNCDGEFGYNVKVGDITGDSVDDIIVVARTAGTTSQGALHVIFGSTDMAESIDLSTADYTHAVVTGSYDNGFLGQRIFLGDADNDGILDILASEYIDSALSTTIVNMADSSEVSETEVTGDTANWWGCSFSTHELLYHNFYWGLFMLGAFSLFLFRVFISCKKKSFQFFKCFLMVGLSLSFLVSFDSLAANRFSVIGTRPVSDGGYFFTVQESETLEQWQWSINR